MLPFFSMWTWSLLILFITLLVIYGVWPYGFFKNLGVPGPQPWPFVGSMGSLVAMGVHKFDQWCCQTYGRMWGMFEGRNPVLMVSDPGVIKIVMIKEFHSSFTNRRKATLGGPMADGVFAVEDEKWKRIRNSLSPTFTTGRMKEVSPIAEEYANHLVEHLKKQNLKKPVNVKDVFGKYCMDVLTSTSFSVETDSINNPDDPFVVNMKKLMTFSLTNPVFLISILFPSLVPLMEKMGFTIFSSTLIDYFYRAIQKIKDQSHKGQDAMGRVDFLQLMVRSQISEEEAEKNNEDQPVKGLTDHEILSQSFIFILAGYETTRTSLASILYNMAVHPEALSKVVEEIDSVVPNNAAVTYDKLMQLEYLDMVINESMRVWPPAPRLERRCKQTVVVDGVTIPKDTLVAIPVYALHRDPEFWTSPEVFKPERFSKENKESINPYVYLPFGIGPRNCIGMRFALLVMKMILVRVLQNFSLETCKETQIPVQLDKMYQPTKPIMLSFVPRSHLLVEK